MQLNGISIQPKIGIDFTAQWGETNSVTANSTMATASAPSAQTYNQTRVNQNANPEKIAENISKFDIAQGNYMRQYHGLN